MRGSSPRMTCLHTTNSSWPDLIRPSRSRDHRVKPGDDDWEERLSAGRDGGDFDLEARVGQAGDDDEGCSRARAFEHAVADFPVQSHALRIGDEDMAVHEVTGRHVLRLQDGEDIPPGELVLKPLLGGNVAIDVHSHLSGDVKNTRTA